ncbi:MAG: hypothetical protein ACLSHW_05645 [Lachnospiraceae bacterium]
MGLPCARSTRKDQEGRRAIWYPTGWEMCRKDGVMEPFIEYSRTGCRGFWKPCNEKVSRKSMQKLGGRGDRFQPRLDENP